MKVFWLAPVVLTLLVVFLTSVQAQNGFKAGADEKAEAVLAKAVQSLGGDRYRQVRSQIGRGKFSIIRDGAVTSFQSFTDVIVFPDKERTEFKGGGSHTIQTNAGSTGWIYDGDQKIVKIQTETQLANAKRGLRTSLDYLLRGPWRSDAELTYIGKRAATLGKRNEVVRLTFNDGFAVEFEFAAEDGLPQKAIYTRTTLDGDGVKEEDHYAQFVDVDGVKTPFIIDRFAEGKPTTRINYESVEFNRSIPTSLFVKPASPKDLRNDLK